MHLFLVLNFPNRSFAPAGWSQNTGPKTLYMEDV